MFTVYKITNNTNNKSYIGSSIRVQKRWRDHINTSQNPNNKKYNYPLYQAFRKYGVENFTFEILKDDFDSSEEMQQYEKDMIIHYNSISNGYNQTLETSREGRCSDNLKKYINSTKKKCAKVDKYENILEIYESYHDAAKKNGLDAEDRASAIREVCKGKRSSCMGNIYRDLDENEEVISKPIKKFHGRKNIVAISVEDFEDIKFFESISKAAEIMLTDRGSITKCINGNNRYSIVKKHIFREIDYNGNIIENDIDIDERIKLYNNQYPCIKGERHSIAEWCQIYNVTRQTISRRIKKGMTATEAILQSERR